MKNKERILTKEEIEYILYSIKVLNKIGDEELQIAICKKGTITISKGTVTYII